MDVGILSVRTRAIEGVDGVEGETFAVGRVRKEILGRSYIGGVVTRRDGGGSYNQVLAADANLVIAEHRQVGAMLAHSFEPEAGGERWVRHTAAQWRDDFLQAGFTVLDISPDFNRGVGFVIRRERMMGGSLTLRPRPGGELVRQFEIAPSLVYFHDGERDLTTRRARVRLSTFFQSGDRVQLELRNRVEVLDRPFSIASGVTLTEGGHEWNSANMLLSTFNGRRVQGTVSGEIGSFWTGTKR